MVGLTIKAFELLEFKFINYIPGCYFDKSETFTGEIIFKSEMDIFIISEYMYCKNKFPFAGFGIYTDFLTEMRNGFYLVITKKVNRTRLIGADIFGDDSKRVSDSDYKNLLMKKVESLSWESFIKTPTEKDELIKYKKT